MEELPLVSIVTPSFNQGRFLRRTIDSVLGQDYPRIEYLVLDGGSSDDSVAILRSYGSRLVWVSESDGGQAQAINKGLARARGTIWAYLNSDDVLRPGAVTRVVEYFRGHPQADVVYGLADIIDEEDKVIGRYATEPFSRRRLWQHCLVCQPAAFWRARLARRVGPFNEKLHCCLDYEYWLRLDQAGARFSYIEEVLAQSRLYAATKTLSQRLRVFQENIQVCLAQTRFCELNHFVRLWRHQCWENPRGRFRYLRWLPLFCPAAAFVHYLWSNRRAPWFRQVFLGILRGLKRGWFGDSTRPALTGNRNIG